MTNDELQEKVKSEVGFTLSSLTIPGTNVYAGSIVVLGLDGNILRKATNADIKKWNMVRNRMVTEEVARRKKSNPASQT